MSKVKVPVNCRCGRKTSAVVTKPTTTSKQVGVTTCEHCLSQIEYSITKNEEDKSHNQSGVMVSSRMITISKDLEALMGK